MRMLILALLGGLAAAPASAGNLRIVVDGMRVRTGTLLIGVFDSKASYDRALDNAGKDGFQNDPERVAGIALRVQRGARASLIIPDLLPGTYCVMAFHDENGNGRLDKNFLGVPTEPYGFSNDVQPWVAPPSFAKIAFTLDSADRTVEISLIHAADPGSGSSAPPPSSPNP